MLMPPESNTILDALRRHAQSGGGEAVITQGAIVEILRRDFGRDVIQGLDLIDDLRATGHLRGAAVPHQPASYRIG